MDYCLLTLQLPAGRYLVLLVLILGFVVISIADTSVITIPPTDTVGCWGGRSTLTCYSNRTNVNSIDWVLDGTVLTIQDKESRGISSETLITDEDASSNLSIAGSPINENTQVQCVIAIPVPPYVEAALATFTVGDISPVGDLRAVVNKQNTKMTISWSGPYCLPVNYSYLITVDNGTNVMNYTTTGLNYDIDVTSCDIHVVNVTVLSERPIQSRSQTVSVQTGPLVGDLKIIAIRASSVVLFQNNTSFCDFEFKGDAKSHICNSAVITVNSVHPPDIYSTNDTIDLAGRFNASNGVGKIRLGPFEQRFRGDVRIAPKADPENVSCFEISTFHVQNVTVLESDGSVSVMCIFAENSFAEACKVTFNDTEEIIITKLKDNDIAIGYIQLKEGVYDVSAYDIVDGVVSTYEAFVKEGVAISFPEKCTTTSVLMDPYQSSTPIIYLSDSILPTVSHVTETSVTAEIIIATCIAVCLVIAIAVAIVILRRTRHYLQKKKLNLNQGRVLTGKGVSELTDCNKGLVDTSSSLKPDLPVHIVPVNDKEGNGLPSDDPSISSKTQVKEDAVSSPYFSYPEGTTESQFSVREEHVNGWIRPSVVCPDHVKHPQNDGEKISGTTRNGIEEQALDVCLAKESADSGIEKFEHVHTSNVVPQEVHVHVSLEDKTDDSLAYRTGSKEEFSLNMEPSSAGNDSTKPVFKGASPDNGDSALPTCTLTETDTEEISGSKKQDCDKIGENSGNHSTSVFVLK